MNPRDYRTWKSLGDHPIFSPRAHEFAKWSSDPEVYEDCTHLPWEYNPDWYVHIDPRFPVEVQAETALRDLKNLAATCDALSQRFGKLNHEIFILDDLTVYVHVSADEITLDFYPVHFDENNVILMFFIESPIEVDELTFTCISDVVPELNKLLGSA